jgi:hypothetical protein
LVEGAVELVESDMGDMADGLGEEDGDVIVVKAVDDLVSAPRPGNEVEVAELAELVGDGGGVDAEHLGELVDGRGRLMHPGEDPQARRRAERLQDLGDIVSELALERRQDG